MKKLKRRLGLITSALILGGSMSAALAQSDPEVLLFRDYEDYGGGQYIGNYNNSYGTANWLFNNFKASTAVEGFDGIAAKFGKSDSSEKFYLPDTVENGTVYISFLQTGSDSSVANFYFGQNSDDIVFFAWHPGQSYYTGNKAWGGTASTGMSGAGTSYKIDVVMTLNDEGCFRSAYINGLNIYENAKMTADLRTGYATMKTDPVSAIDDFSIVYYPEGTEPATFSVKSAEADEKNDQIRVILKSDAYDSDGKKGTEELSAPYGITLPNEDGMNSSYLISEDSFVVEGMNVLSVERGLKSGEYVLTVDGDIKNGMEYTVRARRDLVDIAGSKLNPLADGVTVTAGEPLEAKIKNVSGKAVVEFNDDIYNTWEYAKGASVKDLYTGKTGNVTLSKQSSNQVLISGYAFEEGNEYIITLPAKLRSKGGNTISNNEINFNLAKSGSLSSLRLVDIMGEKHILSDKNPVETDCFEFNFTDDITAENVLDNITITDSASGEELTDFITECEGNTALFKLNRILTGGTTYKISITGLEQEYSISVATENTGFKKLPARFLDADGNELKSMEGLKESDVVSVRLGFVNATAETEAFLASACLFSGQELTGFDFEEVSMAPTVSGGTGKHRSEFKFTVGKNTDSLKLKGYMWANEDGKFSPVEAAEAFK